MTHASLLSVAPLTACIVTEVYYLNVALALFNTGSSFVAEFCIVTDIPLAMGNVHRPFNFQTLLIRSCQLRQHITSFVSPLHSYQGNISQNVVVTFFTMVTTIVWPSLPSHLHNLLTSGSGLVPGFEVKRCSDHYACHGLPRHLRRNHHLAVVQD